MRCADSCAVKRNVDRDHPNIDRYTPEPEDPCFDWTRILLIAAYDKVITADQALILHEMVVTDNDDWGSRRQLALAEWNRTITPRQRQELGSYWNAWRNASRPGMGQ